MPSEFVCPLKEYTPTLSAVFFRKIKVVLARLAVPVRVICQYPLRQRLGILERRLGKDIPTTTHRPDFNAASTAFKHFALVLSVSWLTCSYPAGSKCCLYNLDFPIAGYPTNITRCGFPSERGGGTSGVEVGTKGGPDGLVRVREISTWVQGGVRTSDGKGGWVKASEGILCGRFAKEIFLQQSNRLVQEAQGMIGKANRPQACGSPLRH